MKGFSFFLAIFLQGSKWSEEVEREEKSPTYLLTCRQYQTHMKNVQRREQCWSKENLVWENQTIVKSMPTTEPRKSKSHGAAAH